MPELHQVQYVKHIPEPLLWDSAEEQDDIIALNLDTFISFCSDLLYTQLETQSTSNISAGKVKT